MQRLYRLPLTLFFFSFASPAFAFSPRSELEELIIAAAGSTVCSLIAIVVVLVKSNKSFLPRLLMALASPLLVFPVCMGGSMATSYLVKQASDAKKEQNTALRIQEETEAWQRNALRTAACEGDSATLKLELASNAHDQTTKQRVLEECVLSSADVASLQAFLLDMQTRSNTGPKDYCAYLNPALQGMNIRLLDVFVEQKLSLDCSSGSQSDDWETTSAIPSWWRMVGELENTDMEKLLEVLRYLKIHGVDMKVVVNGRSLLSIAMEKSATELILFALDAGVDPYLIPTRDYTYSPLETWTLQRFYFTGLGTYDEADRKRIQARLREMTAKEADALTHKMRDTGNLKARDGGAGLLGYLIKSGANLRLMNQNGNGIFQAYAYLSPAMLEVLDKLNDQQLRDFICPEPVPENDTYSGAYSVYENAIENKNERLVNFLKQRNMPETCPRTDNGKQ